MNFWTIVFIGGFIVAQVTGGLLTKFASESKGTSAMTYFIAANVIGMGCPFFLMLALKGQNPNYIYALCIGGGFCVLQLISWYLFKLPISNWQWMGVSFIALGIFLLQVK